MGSMVHSRVLREADAYGRDAAELGGYATLMGVYVAGTAAAAALARRLGRPSLPASSPWEAAQLAIATHRISRTIAKDPVTSPLRAPFTEFTGETSAPGELAENVRGHGLKHSAGELLTCPMCLAQWVATGLALGQVFAPVSTRAVTTVFTAVAGADFLQFLYARLQQSTM